MTVRAHARRMAAEIMTAQVDARAAQLAAGIGDGAQTLDELSATERAQCYARAEQAIADEWAEADEYYREQRSTGGIV